VDRVALHDQADAGGDQQLAGGRGRRGECDERVVGVAVLARQLAAAGIRRRAADRDVRVLGDEQRLEPVLLDHPRQLVRLDRVLGGKREDADLHGR
jgi:hypothetical protein